MLKLLRRIEEKKLRGSKSAGTRRGLMVLKIFLEMEWMLILGGDLGLYIYLVLFVSCRLFGLKNCKANSDYAFLRFPLESTEDIRPLSSTYSLHG